MRQSAGGVQHKKGGGVPVRVAASRELPVLPSVRRHVHAAPQGDSASLTVRAGQALRRQAKGCLRLHAGDRGRCGHLLPAGDPLLRRNGQCRAGGRAVQPARRAKEARPRPPHPVYRRAATWSGRHRARAERHHRAADRLFQNAGGFPARSVLRGGHPVLLSPAIRRDGARLPGRPNPGARLPLSSAGGQPPVCRRQLRASGALLSAAGVPSGRRPFSGIRRGHERPARTLRKRARAAKHAAKRRSGLRAEGLGGHSRLH